MLTVRVLSSMVLLSICFVAKGDDYRNDPETSKPVLDMLTGARNLDVELFKSAHWAGIRNDAKYKDWGNYLRLMHKKLQRSFSEDYQIRDLTFFNTDGDRQRAVGVRFKGKLALSYSVEKEGDLWKLSEFASVR